MTLTKSEITVFMLLEGIYILYQDGKHCHERVAYGAASFY